MLFSFSIRLISPSFVLPRSWPSRKACEFEQRNTVGWLLYRQQILALGLAEHRKESRCIKGVTFPLGF
jgi:hypothetical protein